jgi:hypothetical protein
MTKDGKENEIDDIQEMDVNETDFSVVEKAIETAFYATEKGKRDLALSESRGRRLDSAYALLAVLRDRLERAEDELERLGGLLSVIRRCADDEAFSIVFDKE